jgi:hypothetical protein
MFGDGTSSYVNGLAGTAGTAGAAGVGVSSSTSGYARIYRLG